MNCADEYHVASFVALVAQAEIANVTHYIATMPGGEVHVQSQMGKLVFTLEANTHKQIAIQMDFLKDMQGVLSLAPVYHQYISE
ncbi:sorbose reductase [Thalassotalea litorea]|uniref:Chaperone NapD n=1 Tax=Thalassotalea litorea TaxID=2020715 RepID=A0A5R9IMU5_9GAMM|nr:chaperone NapD [Thalassotalea litorea]TLU66860.1 sorbose reductase [Thalassotalea litorea]